MGEPGGAFELELAACQGDAGGAAGTLMLPFPMGKDCPEGARALYGLGSELPSLEEALEAPREQTREVEVLLPRTDLGGSTWGRLTG